MNKKLSTKEQKLLSSWTKWIWKISFFFDKLKNGTFQPAFANFSGFFINIINLFTMLKSYIGTHFRQGVNYGSRAC